jgi:hypothetical protein
MALRISHGTLILCPLRALKSCLLHQTVDSRARQQSPANTEPEYVRSVLDVDDRLKFVLADLQGRFRGPLRLLRFRVGNRIPSK